MRSSLCGATAPTAHNRTPNPRNPQKLPKVCGLELRIDLVPSLSSEHQAERSDSTWPMFNSPQAWCRLAVDGSNCCRESSGIRLYLPRVSPRFTRWRRVNHKRWETAPLLFTKVRSVWMIFFVTGTGTSFKCPACRIAYVSQDYVDRHVKTCRAVRNNDRAGEHCLPAFNLRLMHNFKQNQTAECSTVSSNQFLNVSISFLDSESLRLFFGQCYIGHRLKDIPAQWAEIRQGLDIFRIGSKCVYLSNGEV